MFFDWLKNDDAEFDKAPEYLDVGTSWFDATQLGLVRRIRLSFAGWRDGRRNLVVVSDGVAKSAYLDSLRASFLAEIEALAQKRHALLGLAQDEIDRLKVDIALVDERLEALEKQRAEEARRTEQEDETDPVTSQMSEWSKQRRDKDACNLRAAIAETEKRLVRLTVWKAFLANDAKLKESLIIERYRESAAWYLRGADACRHHAACIDAQPPCIQEDADKIIARAIGECAIGEETEER